MRYAEGAWVVAILLLGIYETWALTTGNTTLSRAVWTAERGQYGPLIPFLIGMLAAHFVWCGR